MANDLTDATTHVTRTAARGTETTGACWPCQLDTHSGCTGVDCMPLCDHPYHSRKPGVSGLSDGFAGGSK